MESTKNRADSRPPQQGTCIVRPLACIAVTAMATVITAGISRAEDAATASDGIPRLQAAVAAAWTEFEAGHWPQSTASARKVLAQFKDDEADHHALRGDLLRLLAVTHQVDAAAAVAAYDKALAAGIRGAEVYEGKGRALRLLEREAEAVTCFDQALALRPDHADTLEARGLARMELHDNDAALADLARASQLEPKNPRRRIALASMHRRLGDVAAAGQALEEAVKLTTAAGDDCRRGEALAELRRWQDAVEAQTAAIGRDGQNLRALSLRSVAHTKKHDAAAALADAREIARRDPGDAGHWLRIGTIELDDLHDAAAALKSFDRGLELAPHDVDLLLARGRSRSSRNDYEAAVADFDAAAATNPQGLRVHAARAALHARRREFKEAVAAYDRILAVVPRNPFTLRDRATAHWSLGDEKQALADCDAAIALLPSRDHAGRGEIQREAKRWPESIEAYTLAIAADPGNARLLHDRAWIYNETSDHEKAAADCRAGLVVDPDDDDLQEELAYALKGLGDHDGAIEAFTKLIDRNPKGDAALYEYRGDARMAKKDYAAARADYERARDISPLVPKNWTNLGKASEAGGDVEKAAECFRRAAQIPPRDESTMLEPGRLFYRQKDHARARTEFERVTREEPANASAWDWLGATHREAGDLDKALTCFDEAIRLEPGRAHFHRNRAALLRRQEKYPEAVAAYDRAIAIEPKYADGYFWRAKCRQKLDDLDGAKADLAEAIRLAPNDAANIRALAWLHYTHDQYAEAIAAYDRAISIAPEYADGYFWRGKCRQKLDDLDGAKADLAEAARLAPNDAANIRALAWLHYTQEQYAEAIAAYDRAIAIAPKYANGYFWRGRCRQMVDDLAGAEADFAEAVRLAPDDWFTHHTLALFYDRQGKHAKAEPLYKQALAIREKSVGPDHPDTAKSLSSLASLYYDVSQYAQAEPLYKRALAIREKSLGPDHPDTAVSLNNLAMVYELQHRYAEAEPLFRRALAIKDKVHGADHPETATTLNNLASLLAGQGKYDEAERLYERAMAIDQKSLGLDHQNYARDLNNLGVMYAKQGNYDRAEPLLKSALAIRERALGPNHPMTMNAHDTLETVRKKRSTKQGSNKQVDR